jgi:hypothetical protein
MLLLSLPLHLLLLAPLLVLLLLLVLQLVLLKNRLAQVVSLVGMLPWTFRFLFFTIILASALLLVRALLM